MTEADALTELQTMTAWDRNPVLTLDEVKMARARSRRADANGRPPLLADGTVNPDWTGTYDLDAGAAWAWETKAGKAREQFGFAVDGQSFQAQQVAEGCEKQAALYRRHVGRTLTLPGYLETAYPMPTLTNAGG